VHAVPNERAGADSGGDAQSGASDEVLRIPSPGLVVLIGPCGAGKTSFAVRHFRPTEVLGSDECRALVADDPHQESATREAFAALQYLAGLRLKLGHLTVVDATNVRPQHRAPLVSLARQHDLPAVAIAFNLDEQLLLERNASRTDRQVEPDAVRYQVRALRHSLDTLAREDFDEVYVLTSPEAIEAARVERVPLPPDRRDEVGPFDVVGDVHGCLDELTELLTLLGYRPDPEAGMLPPAGRRAVFVGDLVDRGPRVVETVALVRRMVAAGQAFCVPGNHDDKLLRYLNGRRVHIAHGIERSIAQIEALPQGERVAWIEGYKALEEALPTHLVLDEGRLVVAHAGMKAEYQGRLSRRVRSFALNGETTGEVDEFGLPVRLNWAADYHGGAAVVYGHSIVPEAVWVNNTIDIDTACVFGGRLTALRWPARELVSVRAHRAYSESRRPHEWLERP
jgi:protein phosphatase